MSHKGKKFLIAGTFVDENGVPRLETSLPRPVQLTAFPNDA